MPCVGIAEVTRGLEEEQVEVAAVVGQPEIPDPGAGQPEHDGMIQAVVPPGSRPSCSGPLATATVPGGSGMGRDPKLVTQCQSRGRPGGQSPGGVKCSPGGPSPVTHCSVSGPASWWRQLSACRYSASVEAGSASCAAT